MFRKSLLSILTLLALTVGALGVTSAHAAGILYVKAGGVGNCSSWATACNLQTALTKAISGQEIWVAAGTYKPGTARSDTFELKSYVGVYGGFAGNETARTQRNPAAHVTILSGDVDNNDSQTPIITNLATVTGNTTNSYHVLFTFDAVGVTLDGFTITAGNAYHEFGDYDGDGAGIYNAGSKLTLANIIFRGNWATFGGGIYNDNYNQNPNLILKDVAFIDNTAIYDGGGMYYGNDGSHPTLTNVTFSKNSAAYGGGMYTVYATLTNVTFSNNLATSQGGGMYSSGVILTKAVFDNNRAAQGGGMYINSHESILTDVIFRNNSASQDGGGIFHADSLAITNATFSNNSASKGGGMYGLDAALTKIVFDNNRAVQGGGMYSTGATLTDVVFHNNSASQDGGGVYGYGLSITNATLSVNSASKGGGIYDGGSTLNNVTFNGNSASNSGGGIYHTSGSATLKNVTFRNNSATNYGGAISNYASSPSNIYSNNTIFWGNTSANGAQIFNSSSRIVYLYNNVIQGGCPTGAYNCTNIITTNPLLGALGNYGGFTQTIPLLAGSSAIDAGDDNSCYVPTDQRGVKRPYGARCDIGAFEYIVPVLNTLTLNSNAGQDGWIIESSETSAVGAAINGNATTFNLGDSIAKQQYLGLLAFNTGSLPDAAIITGVTLKVKKQAVFGGGDPLATFQGFVIDLKNGFFGSSMLLQPSDFQDPASKTLGPISPAPVANVYSINLINGKDYINKLSTNSGLTQIRLRFKLDDNNNVLTNYLSLYSGDAVNAADRPQLIIQYYLLNAPTLTPTKTRTSTRTKTPTSTSTKTLTRTSTPMASVTSTGTYTPTPTPSVTPTLIETETPTPTDTETITPTSTDLETGTPTVTLTPTPLPTETETPTPIN